MPGILYVDITPTHGADSQDLSATITELLRRGEHPSLIALKPAIFRELSAAHALDVQEVQAIDWRNMWVVAEGINRTLPVGFLNGLYRRMLFNSYRARVSEQIEAMIGSIGPDVVHLNGFNVRLAPVYLACHRLRVPVIAHVRTLKRLEKNERKLLAASARVLATSRKLKGYLVEQVGLASDQVSVWHNGIPFARLAASLDRERTRRELQVTSDQVIVSIVGRIAPHRGHDEFLQAGAQIAADHPNVVLLVAGRFHYRNRRFAEALQARYRPLVSAGRLRFVLDRRDTDPFVMASDLIVQPQRTIPATESIVEGIIREVLLAMGLGIPVVATAPEGSAGIVRDQVTACIVPPEDPQAIADRVGRLLADPGEAAAMAGRAKEATLAQHRSSARTSDLLAIYEQMIGKK